MALVAQSTTVQGEASTQRLSGHTDEVTCCAFSPEHLVSGSLDGTLLVWDVFGEPIRSVVQLRGHRRGVTDACWLPQDPTRLLSVSADARAFLWDVSRGEVVRGFRGPRDIVFSCAASADGSFATAGQDRCAHVWDERTREAVAVVPHAHPLTSVCLLDDIRQMVTSGLDGCMRFWDLRKIPGNTPHTSSDSGKLLLRTLTAHAGATVTGMALHGPSDRLATIATDNSVRVWDGRPFVENEAARALGVAQGVRNDERLAMLRCAFAPQDSTVGAGSVDGQLYLWDLPSLALRACLPGHRGPVLDLAFHPSRPLLASASADHSLLLGEWASQMEWASFE